MPSVELSNQRLVNGQQTLPVLQAKVEVSWPEDCTRFDFKRPDVTAAVQAVVEVPKDASPLRPGQVWKMPVARADTLFTLDLLAFQLDDSTDGSDRFHRRHTWSFFIVGFTADPLDLFPRPKFPPVDAEGGQSLEIDLGALKAFLQASMSEAKVARFNSEGGFQL